MKAVIVEIKNSFAAALCDDGCIIKVKNKKYGIGQVIEMKEQNFKNTTMKKIVSLTAGVAAVVMVSSVSALAYFTPNAYVSLDVNPSIEYSVNRFNRVISATAVNGDGTEILDELNLKNKKIEDAIKETVAEISKNHYFEGEYLNTVMIATYSDSDKTSEKLAALLQENADELEIIETETEQTETEQTETVESKTEQTGTEQSETEQSEIEVEVVSIGQARVLEAKGLGVTPGKLNLVQKLQASSENPDSIDVNLWLTKPVKEIMKATKENKKSQKTPEETEVNTSESTEVIASTETETNQTESTTSKTELETIKAIEKAKLEAIKSIEKNKIESIKAIEKTERESIKATEKTERESIKAIEKNELESSKATAAFERENNKASEASERGSSKVAAASERENNKASEASERESSKVEQKDKTSENNANSNGKNK